MRSVSAALAIFTGIVIGLFAFMAVMTAPFRVAQVITIVISLAFLVSGVIAAVGTSVWPLRAVWGAALAGLIYTVATADSGVGLFEGGIMIFLVFGYLCVGLVLSIMARKRGPRIAPQAGRP